QYPARSGSLTARAGSPTIRGLRRGHSSAGRALAWHARGRRFDPVWLHQFSAASPSSRGLGHDPFTVATGVRIPVGTPIQSGDVGQPIGRTDYESGSTIAVGAR